MKFLAILRDSIREAMDYKVLYFLFALSALVILVVASVTYKAEPAEKGLEEIVSRLPGGTGKLGQPGGPMKYTIEDFKHLNEAQPVWQGEFRGVLVASQDDNRRGPAMVEVQDGERKEKKNDKAKDMPSALRLLTLVDIIQRQRNGDLEEKEDQATFEKLTKLISETVGEVERMQKRAGGQPLPPDVMIGLFTESQNKVAALVSHVQLTRFLKNSLASSGTLTVTELKFKEEKDRTFRFDLECKARPETVRTWPHTPVLFFGALKLPFTTGIAPVVQNVETWIVTGWGAGLTLLLSTIITAFFVPSMMRKGTIDLLISKPIHRWYLLVCKFIGGLSFMFFSTVVIIAGIWLVLGVRTGLWSTGFLLGIFVLTLQFAILYAVSVFMGVVTRNPIACILITCAWWFILYLAGSAYIIVDMFREADFMPKWVVTTTEVIHYALPHYRELDILSSRFIAHDLLPADSPDLANIDRMAQSIKWPTSLGITFGFIALLLGLASWRFTVKDY
jgi:ABC-type transport system involved in multi-copper enzyme maturation permease subunit